MWKFLVTPILGPNAVRRIRWWLLGFTLVNTLLGFAATLRHIEINPTDTTQIVISDGGITAGFRERQHASAVVLIASSGPTLGSLGRNQSLSWSFLFVAAAMVVIVAPAVLTATLVGLVVRPRSKIGACPACQYDLTGLPDGRPCPECGKRAG